MLAVIVPLVLAFIFDMVFGGAATPSRFKYGVVDRDGGELARIFEDDVLGEMQRDGVMELSSIATADRARRAVTDGDLDAVFVIPPGFSEAPHGTAATYIEILGNVDSPTATDVAASIAGSFGSELDAVRLSMAALAATSGQELSDAEAEAAASVPAPIRLEDMSTQDKQLDTPTFFAAGMAVFFLFFTVQFGVSSLLEERNHGTMARLLAAPIPRGSILVAKLGGSLVLGVVSMSVLVVASTALMGAEWGNPIGVALLVLSGVLAATAITSVIASVATSTEQAGNWQAVVSVVLGLLGGAFFPLSQAGGFVADLSLLTPHAWFMRGLGDLAGGGIAAALPSVAAISLFAAVVGAFALTRLSKVVRV